MENNTELNYFSCAVNHISELDVSNNTALEEFWCSSNALSEINVSCNTALKTFGCVFNNISELDVSNNTRLENLYCAYNLLTELDLSNNPNFFFDHIRAEGSGTIGLRGKWALAIPNEGASFLGWYTEGGDLITDYWNDISQNDTDSTRVVACFGDADPVAGDADGSGAVDTTDALYVLRCALGISGNAEEMLLLRHRRQRHDRHHRRAHHIEDGAWDHQLIVPKTERRAVGAFTQGCKRARDTEMYPRVLFFRFTSLSSLRALCPQRRLPLRRGGRLLAGGNRFWLPCVRGLRGRSCPRLRGHIESA